MTDRMHGYTNTEVYEMAQRIVRHNRSRWAVAGEALADLADIAWEGLVEAILTAENRPESDALYRAAFEAVRTELRERDRLRGRTWDQVNGGYKQSAYFNRYWQVYTNLEDPTDVVERVAFHQVWEHLTPMEQEAMVTRADFGPDGAAGAEALGILQRTYEDRLRRARARFRTLWFDHEAAPPMRNNATRKPAISAANKRRHAQQEAA